jgi:hypothetical protein
MAAVECRRVLLLVIFAWCGSPPLTPVLFVTAGMIGTMPFSLPCTLGLSLRFSVKRKTQMCIVVETQVMHNRGLLPALFKGLCPNKYSTVSQISQAHILLFSPTTFPILDETMDTALIIIIITADPRPA